MAESPELTLEGLRRRVQAEPVHGVLSLNLCGDQILLALADPGDVAGVTPLARDCRLSAVCVAARDVPEVRGTAEERTSARFW